MENDLLSTRSVGKARGRRKSAWCKNKGGEANQPLDHVLVLPIAENYSCTPLYGNKNESALEVGFAARKSNKI